VKAQGRPCNGPANLSKTAGAESLQRPDA